MKGFTKDFEDLMLSLMDSNQQIKPRNNKI